MAFLRCCSTNLEECGVIGNVEKITTPNDIADCHVEENFQLHEFMIDFSKELEDNKNCFGRLKSVRIKRFAPRYKPY